MSTEQTDRVEDLEIRMAFLERTVQDLDEVVREAHDEIARLRGQLKKLEEKLDRSEPTVHVGSLQDEVPPHY